MGKQLICDFIFFKEKNASFALNKNELNYNINTDNLTLDKL